MTREQLNKLNLIVKEIDDIKDILRVTTDRPYNLILKVANYKATLNIEKDTDLYNSIVRRLNILLNEKEAIIIKS